MKKTSLIMVSIYLLFMTIFVRGALPVGEVDFRISVKNNVCRQGESIVINFAVSNNTNHSVVLWNSQFFVNHRFVIKDGKGTVPKLTEAGKTFARWFDPYGERMGNFSVTLAPQETDQSIQSIVLSDIFELPVGLYYLKTIYEDGQCVGFSGILSSNELVLEVVSSDLTSQRSIR